MKCKNCTLEEVLNEREAKKKWKEYIKKTQRKNKVEAIGTVIAWIFFFALEILWTKVTANQPMNLAVEAFVIIHAAIVIVALLIGMIYYIAIAPDKIKKKEENMKQKFTEKFPDDARYLE